MTKLKISIIGAIVIAGVAASMLLRQTAQTKLLEKEQALRLQDKQLAELTAEQQRLSNRIALAKHPTVDDRMTELVKLRGEAGYLRTQTHALRKQLEQKGQKPSSQSKPTEAPHPPEYYEQLHQMAGGKQIDARNLAAMFLRYAWDHQDQYPTNCNQVASYLSKEKMSLTGTNEFDIVYQGSLDRLKNIPIGSVAVIRSRQTFLTPDGKIARVYGLADGSSQIVASDDNFKAWEAEHILPPPTGQQ